PHDSQASLTPLSPVTTLFRPNTRGADGRSNRAFCCRAQPFREAHRSRSPEAGQRGPQETMAETSDQGRERAAMRFSKGLGAAARSEEHTSELQSLTHIVCPLL